MKQESFQRMIETHNSDNSSLFKTERISDMNNFFSLFMLFSQHNNNDKELIITKRLEELMLQDINDIRKFSKIFNSFYWVRNNYFRMKPFDKWEKMQDLLENKLLSILREQNTDKKKFLEDLTVLFENVSFLKGKMKKETIDIIQKLGEEL